MVNIQSKATKFASFIAIGAIALSGALSGLKSAHAGGDGAYTVPNCKWVTLTRTIKAPFTVPAILADVVPATTSGCIVWLNRAVHGTGYKVDFFIDKTRTVSVEFWREQDTDGTVNDYYKVTP